MEVSNIAENASLSKNALKKRKKLEKLEEQRKRRKESRKQNRKERKEKRKNDPNYNSASNSTRLAKKEDKQRSLEAKANGVRLVIDLSFTYLMTTKEVGSLCRQLTTIYAENKRSSHPFHLYFTSLSGSFKEAFEKTNPTYLNWIVDFCEASYLEVFKEEKESIVYLTADASFDLLSETTQNDQSIAFPKDRILVIGGLIDRNRHKNVCFDEASKLGIRTAHLPLHLIEGGSKVKVLTTNQCAEMLLRYSETLDWRIAVESIVPKRKLKQTQSISQTSKPIIVPEVSRIEQATPKDSNVQQNL